MDELILVKERAVNLRYLHEILHKQEIPFQLNSLLKTYLLKHNNIKNVIISFKAVAHINIIPHKRNKAFQIIHRIDSNKENLIKFKINVL